MKRILTVFIFSILTCSVHAQISPKQEKIKTLFSLMHQDVLVNKIFDAMGSSMAANFNSEMKDSSLNRQMAEAMQKAMEISKAAAKKLLDIDMVTIYDKYFTENEIDDFISFYKTASGQKMISTIPDIQKETMTIMAQKYGPEIQANMSKVFEGINAQPPKSTSEN